MSEKWWDMSDDELDDLFREASDKAEIPFDSSALDKLRQKMDFKPMPEPSQGFKKRWIALAALLIFVGVALLYTFSTIVDEKTPTITNKKTSTKTSKGINSIENKQTNNFQKEIENDKELNNLSNIKKLEVSTNENNAISKINELKGNSINETVIRSSIGQNKKSKIIANSVSEKSVKRTYSSNKNLSNQGKSSDISEDNLLKNKQLEILDNKTTDEETATENSVSNSNNSTIIKGDNNDNEVKSITNLAETKSRKSELKKSKINNSQDKSSIYSETNPSISTPVIISENKLVEEETIVRSNFYNVDFLNNKPTKPLEIRVESESPTYVDAPPIVMKQPKFSRFGVRLAIAPDINSLERLSTSALGSSAGILLEYRLSKKFILQTGVTYSIKKYTGSFDDYRNWANNWKNYHPSKPTGVDGGCNIIDVPLNIRFNVFQKPRNTFFVSSGISTYFMMNESYTYTYAWAPERTVNWNDKSSFYWSTINISAGIERKLTKHFTFQIEPYLKTPLSNIGRGGVSLYSSGLLFSTKYEF
jgi:hypothetical protein